MRKKTHTIALLAALVGITSVLTVNNVNAQYLDLEFADCSEKLGGLKVLRSIVYGLTSGVETNPNPHPFLVQYVNGLTQGLLELEADYDSTCGN